MAISSTLIINLITISLLFIALIYFSLVISTSVGFKNLFTYYSAFKGKRKGILLIRVSTEDLNTEIYTGKIKASKLVLTNLKGQEKDSSFILKSDCIYTNEFGIRCIDYYDSDIDPKDPKTGDIVTTSPMALQNIITNATKAESLSNGIQDFFLKNFYIIGLGLLVLVGMLGFLILTQNGDITACYQQLSSIKVVAS